MRFFKTFLNSQLAFILAMNVALCKWDRQRIRFQKTIHRDILFFHLSSQNLKFSEQSIGLYFGRECSFM